MSGIFGGGGTVVKQVARTPTPAPERTPEQTKASAERQRFRFFNGSGRMSTMLTGGLGSQGGSAAVRYLGGAART